MSRTSPWIVALALVAGGSVVAGDECCKKSGCPKAEKVAKLIDAWKTATSEEQGMCPVAKGQVYSSFAEARKACPTVSRLEGTLSFTRSVLEASVAADPDCLKKCAQEGKACTGGAGETTACQGCDPEMCKLLVARSNLARDLLQLTSFATEAVCGSGTKAAGCAGVQTSAVAPAGGCTKGEVTAAAAATQGSCAKGQTAVAAGSCAKAEGTKCAEAATCAAEGKCCSGEKAAAAAAGGCCAAKTAAAAATEGSCAKGQTAVAAGTCAKAEGTKCAEVAKIAAEGAKCCATEATAAAAAEGCCAAKTAAAAATEGSCAKGQTAVAAGSEGSCAKAPAAVAAAAEGSCSKAQTTALAAATCCPKALAAKAAELKTGWEKVPAEYASMCPDKKKEMQASMASIQKGSKVLGLLPETVLALTDGVEALDAMNARIREHATAKPESVKNVPDDVKSRFESQSLLVHEASEVLGRVRTAMRAAAEGASGATKSVVLQGN